MDVRAAVRELKLDLSGAKLIDQRDIVCAWKHDQFPLPEVAEELRSGVALEATCSIEYRTTLMTSATENARGILCTCGAQKFVSGTFRLPGNAAKPFRTASFTRDVPDKLRCKKADAGFVYQTDDIAQFLVDRLRSFGDSHHGLVVFSGSTNAGKTDTSKAFLLRLLNGTRPAEKWPHLVTFEDPLEQWPVRYPDEPFLFDPVSAQSLGLYFTPRQASTNKSGIIDVVSLADASANLLRQTASAFYIGEIRNDLDWQHALFLAGTGHLIVTTTHAGSLTETVQRILAAARVRTEGQRGFIASKVRAVVNLEAVTLEIGGEKKAALLASAWFNSTEAVANLVSDGLSSIISNGQFVIGKGAFAKFCPIDATVCSDKDKWQGAAIQHGLLADVLNM